MGPQLVIAVERPRLRAGLVLGALVLLAAPVLAWHLMPATVMADDRVDELTLTTDRPHLSTHAWTARFDLPLGGFAYTLDASLPVSLSGKPGAEGAPIALALDVFVNGALAARERAEDPALDGIARLAWPSDVEEQALRAGANEVRFELVVEARGGSVMPGWWNVEAGPARVVVAPR